MNDTVEPFTLAGHPFAPTGRGEDVRCTFRALRSVAVRPAVVDIYGLVEAAAEAKREFGPYVRIGTGKISVFHINGDEVEQVLAHLEDRCEPGSYNIVYPAWELSRYPDEWARQLDRFDEIWAPSKFTQKGLVDACKRPVMRMPLATEVVLSSFLGRRYFGIPEADYVFLFFFDLRSYIARKNPEAVIEAFCRMNAKRPYAQTRLVIKVNGGEHNTDALERLRIGMQELRDSGILVDRSMTDNEVKNLVRCCDCFVSLHRSEGYGRGMAEAMYLGKPVIATAYSGNMDFMSPDTALLVPFELIPVPEGAYPHWQDQVWADPDIDATSDSMVRLVDDPRFGRVLGKDASRHIRLEFGYRATGLRYRQRLQEIAARPPETQ